MDTQLDPAAGRAMRPVKAPSCAMVIFGASGDLTKRLLMPALYNLARASRLSEKFALIGVDRSEKSHEDFREELADGVRHFVSDTATAPVAEPFDAKTWDFLAARMTHVDGNVLQPELYSRLAEALKAIETEHGTGGNVIFYLAVASSLFGPVIDGLAASGLMDETDAHWRRVIIEKPFGTDLASARALDARILKVLSESQIFRMDHFLGKETVGVERRAAFYEATGALRDMVPNHVFQLLSLTAMEPPNSFAADAVRTEKDKVLEAVVPLDLDDVRRRVVRGQYGAGTVRGQPVKAYRSEEGVAPDSMTETYVAMRLAIDNWRWADVPFYLRTGKSLARRTTEIAIQFKRVPFALFRDTAVDALTPNVLALQIQPDEGISLQFGAKKPGPEIRLGGVRMNFRYKDYFDAAPSTGYETLVYDCMIGDATLFQRADSVEAGWAVVQPILDLWQNDKTVPLEFYPAGAAGPDAAEQLLWRSGRKWRPVG